MSLVFCLGCSIRSPLVNYSARRQSAKSTIPPNFGPKNVLGTKNRIESHGTGQGMPIFQGSTLQKDRLSEKREFKFLAGCKSWPIDTDGVNPAWIWRSDVNPDFFCLFFYQEVVTITGTKFFSLYLSVKRKSIIPANWEHSSITTAEEDASNYHMP